jgi:hypothetical protein
VPALFGRLPRLFYRPGPTRPLVPDPDGYPALAGDIAKLDAKLVPAFVRFDQAALRAQNTHRLMRLAIILSALAAALLGVWNNAADGATAVGVIEVCVSGLGAALAWVMRKREAQRRFLHARLTAELLRSEYFRFLGRTDGYADEERESLLETRVAVLDTEAPV